MIVLGLLAMLTPALSLAAGGGGSAGDQQYTDPFAGTPAGKAKGSGGSSSTASTPSPASTTVTSVATATTPTTTPTATTAAGTSSDPIGRSRTLPYTGFESWEAAGFGLVLLVGGLGLRRGTRGS
jgi:hypothetical protein